MPEQPYADAARAYWDSGWRGVLPLPPRAKKHPPRGWTGAGAPDPSWPDVAAWTEEQPDGNVALRIPNGVIGIDVDAYPGKRGADTAAECMAAWGELPATWRSTARDDSLSGILLYRVTPGLRWPGELPGGDVELIQHRHRYAVVWPSVHPELGTAYRWYTPDDVVAVGGRVPAITDLPWLPAEWVDGLTGHRFEADTTKAALAVGDASAWLAAVPDGHLCRRMTQIITDARVDLAGPGSRHDAMTRAVGRVVRAADGGHTGYLVARDTVFDLFVTAAGRGGAGQRDHDTATDEYRRALMGAVALVVGDPSDTARPTVDPCVDPFAGLLIPDSPRATPTPSNLATTTAPLTPPLAPAATANPASDDSHDHATRADLDALIAPSQAPLPPADITVPSPRPEPTQTGPTPPSVEAPGPVVEEADPDDEHAARALELATNRAQLADQETERLRARRAAQRALDDEEHHATFRVPPSLPSLTDELAIPDEPVTYTVDQVLPTGGNVLLTAGFKTGKTTLMGNLIRSLADGDPFLGEYAITAPDVGRVAMWNYEVDPRQYRRWLRDTGIERTDRVSVLNLRGYRAPLTVKRVEDWAVEWLRAHQITVWIVDPFARAAVGSVTNENDNTEVGAFLDTLDIIKERAGVRDLIMPTHTGRGEMEEGQERARGATRLDDWADVRWLLTKDDRDVRYFRATGRDVDTKESALYYRELSRTLELQGGSRAQTRGNRVDDAVLAVVGERPGVSTRDLRPLTRERLGKASNEDLKQSIDKLAAQGRIRIDEGRGNQPSHHYLAGLHDVTGHQ